MTVKKTTRGAAKKAPKKAAGKKAAAKKTAAKKPAKKAAKKAAPKKAAKDAKKKAPAKKAESAGKKAASPMPQTAPAEPKKAKSKGGASSIDVTLGHIFALRPRVDRSFRQSNLAEAKRALATESYLDLQAAARAVAEEALALTRGAAQRPDRRRR